MKEYIIHYDEIIGTSVIHGQKTPPFKDREAANEAWKAMKSMPTVYTNMEPEVVDYDETEEHIVTVAFKIYHYKVVGPVKRDDFVTVISGGASVDLKVLDVDPKDTPNISLKYVEEVKPKKNKR